VHVSITRTHDPHDQPLGVATIAGEEMLPWLSEIDGFEGLMMVTDASTGTTLVLTFWESEEVAERHREARRRFRESVTSAVNVDVVDTTGFDLAFVNLGPWAVGRDDG
jgi:hypothetical protein